MVWILAFFLVILALWCLTLDNKIHKLVTNQSLGFSFAYIFDASQAVLHHSAFKKLVGIKSPEPIEEWEKWSKADQKKVGAVMDTVRNIARLRIGYLPPSETFFVQRDGKTILVNKRFDTTSLCSECILGDPDGMKEHLSLEIVERSIRLSEAYHYQPVISVYLRYQESWLNEKPITHLFDLPYMLSLTVEEYQSLGFEVKQEGGDDIYYDSFGDGHSLPIETTLSKNNATIRLNC